MLVGEMEALGRLRLRGNGCWERLGSGDSSANGQLARWWVRGSVMAEGREECQVVLEVFVFSVCWNPLCGDVAFNLYLSFALTLRSLCARRCLSRRAPPSRGIRYQPRKR